MIKFILVLSLLVGCGHANKPKDGKDGADGSSCSVYPVSNGAIITCTDGTQSVIFNGLKGETGDKGETGNVGDTGSAGRDGVDGRDGSDGADAPIQAYGVSSVIDVCGTKPGMFNEVLLKLNNGQIMAHYSDGQKQFLSLLGPGSYQTTDGTGCFFTVTTDFQITDEHY